jgi:Xaa-Pro aminopeptidase
VHFSAEEYAARIEKVSRGMADRGLDVLIAFANSAIPGHVRYLAGFEPRLGVHTSAIFAMAPASTDLYLLLTNAFWETYQEDSWVQNVVITPDYGLELVKWLPPPTRRIGLAGYDAFPTPVYIALREAFAGAEVTDASDIVLAARAVKSPAEVETIRHVAHIANQGAQACLDAVAPGRTEREILVEVECVLKSAGSDELAFGTQVYSGPRTALGISMPSDRRIEPGDVVQVDCGPTYHGYQGDISRCTTAGMISAEVRRILDVTAEMYWRCVETIRPGVRCSDVANAGIEVARRRGCEEYLYRSPNHESGYMGHSIGCRANEPPELSVDNDLVIQENMMFVIEPILGVPGLAGAKLEDVVWVTADGVEHFAVADLEPWKR